jgi:hypothetical protein
VKFRGPEVARNAANSETKTRRRSMMSYTEGEKSVLVCVQGALCVVESWTKIHVTFNQFGHFKGLTTDRMQFTEVFYRDFVPI